MKLSEALARTSINRLTSLSYLSDVLAPDIIEFYLQSNGVYPKKTKDTNECNGLGLGCRRHVTC